MDYIEVNFTGDEDQEVLIARLAETGFESFVETENGFQAYIPAKQFKEQDVKDILTQLESGFSFNFQFIKDQNWNAVWESNYEPVLIADKCYIRAPFHPSMPDVETEIIIEPKMSFGTAHHETTSMMVEMLHSLDLKGKKVLDMGCGTGILAILAGIKGATEIVAIDNDEWAYRNTIENIQVNHCEHIQVFLGDASLLQNQKFDCIVANINRNILLNDIHAYAKSLVEGGQLLMSGFYKKDIPAISEEAEKYHLKYDFHYTKNQWAAVHYTFKS